MDSSNQNKQPLSTKGDAKEKEEQLGGTTNLSLDQLKKEGDAGRDNPNNIENPDDLHEVRVGDDLGEPDADQ